MASTKPMHIYVGVGVSGQLPSRKIAPRLGLGFGLGLALKLGLRGQFPSGAIVLEPGVGVLLPNFQ